MLNTHLCRAVYRIGLLNENTHDSLQLWVSCLRTLYNIILKKNEVKNKNAPWLVYNKFESLTIIKLKKNEIIIIITIIIIIIIIIIVIKHSTAHCIFDSLLSVWKCGQLRMLVWIIVICRELFYKTKPLLLDFFFFSNNF